jgi:hypothetical protein
MLYATGRVRAQVLIGMLNMTVSIVVTYFLLAPADAKIPGFGLGAVGLVGKMVVLQFIMVNIVALYLAKSMRIKVDWTYQLIGCFGCFGSGWLAYTISREFSLFYSQAWFGFLVAAVLHLIMVLVLVWIMPSLTGFSRSEILLELRRLIGSKFGYRN